MGRAQCKSQVGLNLLGVFFKVLTDLCCEKPGDQISDANGHYLHKADRMRKILMEPLNQGREERRNVSQEIQIRHAYPPDDAFLAE